MLKTNICSTTKYANTVRIFLFAIFGFEISYLWALDLLSQSGKWKYMEEPVLQSRPSRQSVLWFGRDQFMTQKGLFLAVWLIYKNQEKKNGNNLRHFPIAVQRSKNFIMSGPPLNGKCLKSQWLLLDIKKDEDFLKLFCWLPPRIRRNENWESFPPNRRQQSLLTSATPPVIEKNLSFDKNNPPI